MHSTDYVVVLCNLSNPFPWGGMGNNITEVPRGRKGPPGWILVLGLNPGALDLQRQWVTTPYLQTKETYLKPPHPPATEDPPTGTVNST